MNTEPRTAVIELSQIDEGERARQEYGNLEELKLSIAERGVISPLAVKEQGEGLPFLLLAGGRRFRACKQLELSRIPVRIYDHDLSVDEAKTIELEENLNRLDLTWDEEVILKRQINDRQIAIHGLKTSTSPTAEGWSQAKTAEMLEETPSNLSRDLKLARALDLVPELKECKTKDEAFKTLRKLETQLTNAVACRDILERQAATPIEVLRKRIADSFILRDCLDGMQKVPENTVDLVEIDPPYAIKLMDIKFAMTHGDCKHDKVNESDYNEIPEDQYLAFMERVLAQSFRVMKPDSFLLLWFAPDPWFEPLFQLLIKVGFRCKRLPLIWTKPTGQTNMPARYLAQAYEMCFYARKGDPQIQRQGRLNNFQYTWTPQSDRIHPTERPRALMEDLLNTFARPGATVMVPFAGSGNTILAAYTLGMNAFGYDLSPTYRDAFVVRANGFTPRGFIA